ncbi:hypothetical protein SeLEV6574_g05214 [Synchytrium endobioticum]|uniref:USP domain-containing protein n=1 Tax=Synchytrium endobioticum TaxID=286115 RepID=A0A507CVG8_9FUNG|nr:hypothetical protein SeLEV6574_g05214 [Synchytrium endobioticum]
MSESAPQQNIRRSARLGSPIPTPDPPYDNNAVCGEIFEESRSHLSRLKKNETSDTFFIDRVIRWRLPIGGFNDSRALPKLKLLSPKFKCFPYEWSCRFDLPKQSQLASFYIQLENAEELGYVPQSVMMEVSFRDVKNPGVHLISGKTKYSTFAEGKRQVLSSAACKWTLQDGISMGDNEADVICGIVDIIVAVRIYHSSECLPVYLPCDTTPAMAPLQRRVSSETPVSSGRPIWSKRLMSERRISSGRRISSEQKVSSEKKVSSGKKISSERKTSSERKLHRPALNALLKTSVLAPTVVAIPKTPLANSASSNDTGSLNHDTGAIIARTTTAKPGTQTRTRAASSASRSNNFTRSDSHVDGIKSESPSTYCPEDGGTDSSKIRSPYGPQGAAGRRKSQSGPSGHSSNDDTSGKPERSMTSAPVRHQPYERPSFKPSPVITPLVSTRRESPLRRRHRYVGLSNQGATCYMNSILQSLFFVVPFRDFIKIVATTPMKQFSDRLLVAIKALNKVFDDLKEAKEPVSTKTLTKSFGWDADFTFRQQDPQEFTRCLFEFLENGIKEAGEENIINQLFEGEMETRVECKHITYSSKRVEIFNDIQLDVGGCADLNASFGAFTAKEDLTGDNQYRADSFGLQDAVKFIRFRSLPPVLHLQLKRFHYDVQSDSMKKINSRHSFPIRLDLTPYMSAEAPSKHAQIYVLQGVLVHSGSISGGHYRAYLRPSVEDAWYEFDDENVYRTEFSQVQRNAAGGESSTRSAYMLIYVRESDFGTVLEPADAGKATGVTSPYAGKATGVTSPYAGKATGVTSPYAGKATGVTSPYAGKATGVTSPYVANKSNSARRGKSYNGAGSAGKRKGIDHNKLSLKGDNSDDSDSADDSPTKRVRLQDRLEAVRPKKHSNDQPALDTNGKIVPSSAIPTMDFDIAITGRNNKHQGRQGTCEEESTVAGASLQLAGDAVTSLADNAPVESEDASMPTLLRDSNDCVDSVESSDGPEVQKSRRKRA